MRLPALKMESCTELSDDEREAEKVTSRARLRIAELLQRPFDIRSICLTGLFILAVFLHHPLHAVDMRRLAPFKIPLHVGAAFVLIGLFAIVGYGVSALSAPTAGWLEKGPQGLTELQPPWVYGAFSQQIRKSAPLYPLTPGSLPEAFLSKMAQKLSR
jgi:hypothetical protein